MNWRPRWSVPLLFAALLPAQADPAAPAAAETVALPEGAPPAMANVLRKELSEHAHFLASDELGGRFTGSSSQVKAAEYIAEHFKKLGLKPLGDKKTFFQYIPVEKTWLDASTQLSFGTTTCKTNLSVMIASEADKVATSGRFAYCGDGSPDKVPADLKGKIPVVVLPKARGQGQAGGMSTLQRTEALARQLAKAEATAGVLCLLDDNHPMADANGWMALRPDQPRLKYKGKTRNQQMMPLPVLLLGRKASEQLLQHLGLQVSDEGVTGTADPKATGKLQILVKQDPKATVRNVVACLEGRAKKSEAVVFSAHMDHMGTRLDGDVYNGADDNASGSSGLLTIASAFAKAKEPPARTILFVSVCGEEEGLWGSDWFADNPAWPLAQIVADINIDMIGRNTDLSGADVISVTPSKAHEKYSTLVRHGHELAKRFGLSFSSGDIYYERSDHYNFAKKGVPVVFFCDGEHPDYHKVTDTADKLDYVKMERIARLAFWLGWDTAEDKARPKDLGAQADW
jgi:Peptidase family M28